MSSNYCTEKKFCPPQSSQRQSHRNQRLWTLGKATSMTSESYLDFSQDISRTPKRPKWGSKRTLVEEYEDEAAERKATYLKHESKVYPQVIETIWLKTCIPYHFCPLKPQNSIFSNLTLSRRIPKENVVLGLSKPELARNACFYIELVTVTYGLSFEDLPGHRPGVVNGAHVKWLHF